MAHDAQMSRKELEAAREKVTAQIERLKYRGIYASLGGGKPVRLMAELDALLEEINLELAELGPDHA